MSDRFNLSALALRHQSIVLFLIIVLGLSGTVSFIGLGQQEDPDFTIKTMVVRTFWPGATAREVEQLVTDRLEKGIQEIPYFDFISSYSKAGVSTLLVNVADATPPDQVGESWYQVRKKVADIRHTLPPAVLGPFFNDEFGDTFGTIYAFSADGFTFAELEDYVEDVRKDLLRVPDVRKAEIIGAQDEKIYVEFSYAKLARLGLDPQAILATLQRQNAMRPAGSIDGATDKVYLRVTGGYTTAEAVAETTIDGGGGRLLRLGDIATVRRGTIDPKEFTMRFNGAPVIGLAISMVQGGSVLQLGKNLKAEMTRIKAALPVGIEVAQVSDQPAVVDRSIGEFVTALGEALAIVLLVSFLSLGARTGLVVALSVPLVLAVTFIVMSMLGINLHRISLGALIIALGLLVDDAIIVVEMMMVKMEAGIDRMNAAISAYRSTAFPMLTGTLVTAAGFLPVGFAKSSVAEYTGAIFTVVVVALLLSWLVAVIFTPYLGYHLLPTPKAAGHSHPDPYSRPFYRRFRGFVATCLRWRWTVIGLTAVAFAVSLWGFQFVRQQFFPSSDRLELVIDLRLPEGSSFAATEAAVTVMEEILAGRPEVDHYASYAGGGTPRFYLALNMDLPELNFGQIVVMTKGVAARDRLFRDLRVLFDEDPRFIPLRARVLTLFNGPPVGFPVQFRVIGDDPARLRAVAFKVRTIMEGNAHLRDVQFDWDEFSKVVRIELDHDQARRLGLSVESLSQVLNTLLSGVAVTQYREDDKLIDVVVRAVAADRAHLDRLDEIMIGTPGGRAVPLGQIAHLVYTQEPGVIWRRNRQTALTVKADIADESQPPDVTFQVDPLLDPLRAELPPGWRIEIGGTVEASAKSQAAINKVMPAMMLVMLTVLMLQLGSIQRMIIVVLTAPLGMIGVTTFLLLFDLPFGFVATLGVIALAGMIMRNSVILVDQIEQDITRGIPAFEAITGATTRRLRPIVLTGAAAMLAMIPLSRSIFWGPMATAIMGGLAAATILTVTFLPALYAAWFRIREVQPES